MLSGSGGSGVAPPVPCGPQRLARGLVEAVEIAALHEGQELMGPVEARAAAGVLEPVQVLPGQLGTAPEGARREDLLDGQVAFGVLDVVEPADAPIGGEPRLRGDACARDEQDAASPARMVTTRSSSRSISLPTNCGGISPTAWGIAV